VVRLIEAGPGSICEGEARALPILRRPLCSFYVLFGCPIAVPHWLGPPAAEARRLAATIAINRRLNAPDEARRVPPALHQSLPARMIPEAVEAVLDDEGNPA
jgi:hypothetical protein